MLQRWICASLWFYLWGWNAAIALAGSPTFQESTPDNLAFVHVSPISAERHLHLYMGSGLGWTDFDRDGILDLLFCQGAPAEGMSKANGVPAVQLWGGHGDRFVDCSSAAGLTGTSYGMGLTVADYDNDGFMDMFVTGVFATAMYRNNGDGTFSDQTASAGIALGGFGAGACWTDIDHDGNLDLFYVRYIAIDGLYPLCSTKVNGRRVTVACNPDRIPGDTDSVYRNLGDGRFADLTTASGVETAPKRQGLGIVALDLDDDGYAEIFVANDTSANDLWVRTDQFQLEERGMVAGVALSRSGTAKAGMGIAAGDIDGDLLPDLFVTNYFRETNSLYRNEGALAFLDCSEEFGVATPSRLRLGFGVTLADFDNDGWPDYLVANGHVHDHLSEIKSENEPFAQLPQVLKNRAGRRFQDVSAQSGSFFQTPCVARGTAAADIDGDGRVDVAVLRLNERAVLLRNSTAETGNWIALELQGATSNRDGIGATVIVRRGKQAWRRDRMASASYLSCDSPVLHFGLGDVTDIDSVTVRWPSGRKEVFSSVPARCRSRLVEGTGSVSVH
ncbi:MAG: CRTAC1 family protein [Planctomycetota bacterium]